MSEFDDFYMLNSLSNSSFFDNRADGSELEDSLGGETTENEHSDGPGSCRTLREQDRFLPIANIARIMKKSIPPSGKIAKDAKECVQECVSEFISFITSEASDRCHQEKRKTINGEDILFAMSNLGFDNYVEPLKHYLQRYRDLMPKFKTDGEANFEVFDSNSKSRDDSIVSQHSV